MTSEANEASILVAIHPLTHQGQKLMGDKWPAFLDALRQRLGQQGSEGSDSDNELLLFSFSAPYPALVTTNDALASLRQEFEWNESLGGLPVQIILHFDEDDEHTAALRDPAAPIWDFLGQENFYISRPLKIRWDQFMRGRQLPAHELVSEGMGLFLLRFTESHQLHAEQLFPYRELAWLGPHKECFYCGMTHHPPGACPSKLLTMETQGLGEAGYLPFDELSDIYREAMTHQEKLTGQLTAGVKPSQLRKDLPLQVFVAFFDLGRIYQLRFLHHMAFSFYFKWEAVSRMDKIHIDSRNLHIALDCLRVGQYSQAEKLFNEEMLRRDGKSFYAAVGLAFWALEQGRDKDMHTFLQKAVSLAQEEKEAIYANLLLARYYQLQGDKWKAEHALNSVYSTKRDCQEAHYSHAQSVVRSGFGEQALKQLRSLVLDDKRYLMAILMDPALQPLHTLIDDMIKAQVQALTQDALDQLNQTRNEVAELQRWLEQSDPKLIEIREDFAAIEQQFERRSYYDLLDVANRAQAIYYTSHKLRETKRDELLGRIEEADNRWRSHSAFWRSYPYKPLFGDFGKELKAMQAGIVKARTLADKNQGDAYQAAQKALAAAVEALDQLKPRLTRMLITKMALDGLRTFAKMLVIAEIVLLALVFVAFAALPPLLAGSADGSFTQLLGNPWFQKQTFFVSSVLFAPLLALIITIWKIKDT